MNGLRYVQGCEPGYTRRLVGEAWQYLTERGQVVRRQSIIDRLNSLALPPAYEHTWFAKDPRAHLQATGIDAAGRKQYRYHPDFRSLKEDEKFSRLGEFGANLPRIRAAVERDMARRDLAKERVVAAVVRLLDLGRIRVGNTAYAQANKSFGATTLRNRHVAVRAGRIELDYIGKSGKRQRIGIADARLARLVRKCREEPGHILFQYRDAAGELHPVSSGDVNDWLRENGAAPATAKDFRTWGGSVLAFGLLAANQGRLKLKPMLEHVAQQLGNTPAVARKSYIHPALIEAALDPPERDWRLPRASRWLSREERGLLQFLDGYAGGLS